MNINIEAPINHLSYGMVSTYIIRELSNVARVSLWPIGPISANQPDYIIQALNNSNWPDFNAPCVRIFHQFKLDQWIGRGSRIGFPIFELDRFTELELDNLKNCDKLVTCSKWGVEILKRQTGIPSYVVPLGVDSIYEPQTRRNAYTFISVGKWEYRKGHDALIKAFNQAFTPTDNVELHCFHHNTFIGDCDDWERMYKNTRMSGHITFFPFISRSDFIKRLNSADCIISLSRAEGWNLPILEGMACNKPVITTNYSAHTEFCTNDNSYLINIDSLEDAYDGVFFMNDGLVNTGKWAELGDKQINQAAEYMRFMYDQKLNANPDGLLTANRFTWKNTADKLLEVLG